MVLARREVGLMVYSTRREVSLSLPRREFFLDVLRKNVREKKEVGLMVVVREEEKTKKEVGLMVLRKRVIRVGLLCLPDDVLAGVLSAVETMEDFRRLSCTAKKMSQLSGSVFLGRARRRAGSLERASSFV